MKVRTDSIILRGKKYGDRIVMTPLKTPDWTAYLQELLDLQEQCDYASFQLNIGSDSICPVSMSNSRLMTFTLQDAEIDTVIDRRYIYTPAGVKLYEPVTIKDRRFEYFNWDNTGKVFQSATHGADAVLALSLPEGYIFYEELLGEFTMYYATSNTAGTARTRSIPVTFEQRIKGASYYLKGILTDADEALGNIVVNYNKVRGSIDITGQIMFLRQPGNYDFWWLPYTEPSGGSNYTSRSTTYGMTSVADLSTGKPVLTMQDNRVWGTYKCAGFMLRNYDGATSLGNVNGRDGSATYFFPLFEKE
jgi:hypothetical protein